MSHLSQDNLGHPRLFPTWCVGASSVPGPRCPICPSTTWDIRGCSRDGVWEHHQSQVRDVPSVPGQPGTSEVVVGASSVPGPRCPICPRTTWDIRHGVWEHHQSQVQDVPSVPGQPGTSKVVPDMVCGSIISPRSEMSHLSQDNLGHPRLFPRWCVGVQVRDVPSVLGCPGRLFPTWCVGASSVPGQRCPICPRTTWDIQGCSRHGVWEHHQSQVRDVPSISGCPSKVVPDMVCGSIISPRSEMSHLSQDNLGHGVWEHHQSQLRDVPSVPGQPGTSKVVPDMVCESIISSRSEMSHLS